MKVKSKVKTRITGGKNIHSPLCAGEGNCTCDNPAVLTFSDIPGEWVSIVDDDGQPGFVSMETYLAAFKGKH